MDMSQEIIVGIDIMENRKIGLTSGPSARRQGRRVVAEFKTYGDSTTVNLCRKNTGIATFSCEHCGGHHQTTLIS